MSAEFNKNIVFEKQNSRHLRLNERLTTVIKIGV